MSNKNISRTEEKINTIFLGENIKFLLTMKKI